MCYMGGKNRIRKQISVFLESVRKPEQTYFEPFVGGAWVLQEMSGKRIASDGNNALITMYKALQSGWIPPDEITLEQYNYYKKIKNEQDPMTAFVGFGCSHSGKWFNGFAHSNTRNYCYNAKNSLLKQLEYIKDVEFIYGDFKDHEPRDCLIYCDPPYKDTTSYGYFKSFNYELYYETIKLWSYNNTVIVSEYNMPEDFECVLEINTKTDMRTKNLVEQSRVEKLFRYKRGIK